MQNYQNPISVRREVIAPSGRMPTATLVPVLAVPFHHSEAGVVQQVVNLELEPVPRRLVTDVRAHVQTVYVPPQAVDIFKNGESNEHAGNTEIYRERLLEGEAVFGLENEGEITKRLGINPIRVAGELKVNELVRLSVLVATNHLRLRKYRKAALITDTALDALTPAIIHSNVLDRFNAVLTPEDRINGAVSLGGDLPVTGIGQLASGQASVFQGSTVNDGGGETRTYDKYKLTSSTTAYGFVVETDNTGVPMLRAQMAGKSLSMRDFTRSEIQDGIVRAMNDVLERNPHRGEEQLALAAHGLSYEGNKDPVVLYDRLHTLKRTGERATDGPSLGTVSTNVTANGDAQINLSLMVPKTEFGGMLVTFVAILPDEKLSSQPHPLLAHPWGAINHVEDLMELDPEPVKMRELDSEVEGASEDTVAMYAGHNELRRNYVSYGFNRHVDPTTVDNRTAMFQYKIPLSVSADNILYDLDEVDEYPFGTGVDEIVTYTAATSAVIATPIQYGPTPVEAIAILDERNVFGDVDEEVVV